MIHGNGEGSAGLLQTLPDELLPQVAGRDGYAYPYSVQGRENPFANKRNTLTPNQMRKRKRLIKHIKKSK